MNTQAYQKLEHVSIQARQAREDVSTQARQARELADLLLQLLLTPLFIIKHV